MSDIAQSPHSSLVQTEAEKLILALAAKELGAVWQSSPEKKRLRIYLSEASYVEVDGQSSDPPILAEVFASPRPKGLLPGQKKKLACDILKLITVKQSPKSAWAQAKAYILFSSEIANNSVTGWLREAAKIWKIELHTVSGISDDLNQKLEEAQESQARRFIDSGTVEF